MQGERIKSSRRSRLLAGAVAAAFCAGVVAATMDWSPPANHARDREPASRASKMSPASEKAIVNETETRAGSSVRGLATRQKVKCAGCGVIESMRRIEVDERMAGRCTIDESDPMGWPGLMSNGGHDKEVVTLADTVAGAIGSAEDRRKIRRTTGYQIVVRFRDGTRHTFTEKTPRSLRMGDRILVVGSNRLDG